MSVQAFYDGARYCLAMIRQEPEEALDWALKALAWRELARMRRRRGRS